MAGGYSNRNGAEVGRFTGELDPRSEDGSRQRDVGIGCGGGQQFGGSARHQVFIECPPGVGNVMVNRQEDACPQGAGIQ